MGKFDKLDAGMWISGKGMVYLHCICKIQGTETIFGMVNINAPEEVKFLTAYELEKGMHGANKVFSDMKIVPAPDLHMYDSVRIGDLIHTGVEEGEAVYAKVLAVLGEACLLSTSASNSARKTISALDDMFKGASDELHNKITDAFRESGLRDHLRSHASTNQAFHSADGWYDKN